MSDFVQTRTPGFRCNTGHPMFLSLIGIPYEKPSCRFRTSKRKTV
jgi:hypothetical protein